MTRGVWILVLLLVPGCSDRPEPGAKSSSPAPQQVAEVAVQLPQQAPEPRRETEPLLTAEAPPNLTVTPFPAGRRPSSRPASYVPLPGERLPKPTPIPVLPVRKPDCVLGLATGSTPLGLYQELIRQHREEGLDFSRVTTFNLDEYVGLAPSHPQSYRAFMQTNLFDHINVQPGRTNVPMRMMPFSSRFRSARSLTLGMSRVNSSRPSFVSRISMSNSSM